MKAVYCIQTVRYVEVEVPDRLANLALKNNEAAIEALVNLGYRDDIMSYPVEESETSIMSVNLYDEDAYVDEVISF